MMRYMVSIHHSDDYDPSKEDEAMGHAIDALNEEMVSAGIRVFVGGLHPAGSARSVKMQPDGTLIVSNGSFLKTKDHVGGFWVLEVRSIEEALAWARKAAIACKAPVEVRQFH